jgi:hypothetical protein
MPNVSKDALPRFLFNENKRMLARWMYKLEQDQRMLIDVVFIHSN